MKTRRAALILVSSAAVVLCGWVAHAQTQNLQQPVDQVTPRESPPFNTIKIADDLYVIDGAGCNVAVYITDEGVILADDKYEYHYAKLMQSIRKLTDKPVKYVFNTHFHADHSGGNTHFAPAGAIIISTVKGRENILNKVQPGAPPSLVPASVTFDGEIRIFLGGKEVRAYHYGPAHTGTDAVVYFPARRAVHMGDLVHIGDLERGGQFPLIDYNGGGGLGGWIRTLDTVTANLDVDHVIPGHGTVGRKVDIIAYRNILEGLRDRVAAFIRQGKSEDELKAYLINDQKWPAGGLSIVRGLHGMMVELK